MSSKANKGNRKTATKWEQSGERALIEIWAGNISELRGCRKNSHILMEMVAELEPLGLKYTTFELKTKMDNLTARYRKEKQKMGTTGASPSEWDLYKEMEVLLSPYRSYNCEGLVADCINHMNSMISSSQPSSQPLSPKETPSTVVSSPIPLPSISSQSPLPSTSETQASGSAPASSRARRRKSGESFLKSLREDLKRTAEETLAVVVEKKNLLKAYVEREAEVQKALVDFLKRQ